MTTEDVKFLRECRIDPGVGRIDHPDRSALHCKRLIGGTERAWFDSRDEAERFALDPANPAYHGDLAHLCARCDLHHLSKPEWLQPVLTARDAQFQEEIGIAAPQRMRDSFRCIMCGTVQRDGIEFLILANGDIVCNEACVRESRCQHSQVS